MSDDGRMFGEPGEGVLYRRENLETWLCLQCGARWHPELHGDGSPYRGQLRCPRCPPPLGRGSIRPATP